MSASHLVTVAGATGAQGGAVVRALLETGKYKIRGLTRDRTSAKAQALQRLSNDIEVVNCDITKKEDLERAFKGSWAVFALTDFWAQPDKPEVEYQQGTLMADVASALQIPYYISSVIEDVEKISGGKLSVPHFTLKAKIRDYIKEKHPNLKTIYVEAAMYVQNWTNMGKLPKLDDGTVIFPAPLELKTRLHVVDIEDMGPVVRAILNDPEKYVGQDICVCGEELAFEDIPKIFTKVTGVPAVAKTITEEQFRSNLGALPKSAQDDLFNMFKWFEQYGYYGGQKDWKTGQKLTKLNTFEDWLKKSGWKGE